MLERFHVKAAKVALSASEEIARWAGESPELKGKFFHKGNEAEDKNDHIIHDKKNGALSYDSNGDDKGGEKKFATLEAGLDVGKGDFLVI